VISGYDWFQPSDLQNFFHALQKATQPAILVGGQSLTFWVDYFKIPVPKSDTPYLTQDADVLATKRDARIIAAELHGTLNIPTPGDHTPNTAVVTYSTPDGRTLFVDFMGSLIGLTNEEIRRTAVELEHPKYGFIRILHPTLVLKSRIVNLLAFNPSVTPMVLSRHAWPCRLQMHFSRTLFHWDWPEQNLTAI